MPGFNDIKTVMKRSTKLGYFRLTQTILIKNVSSQLSVYTVLLTKTVNLYANHVFFRLTFGASRITFWILLTIFSSQMDLNDSHVRMSKHEDTS